MPRTPLNIRPSLVALIIVLIGMILPHHASAQWNRKGLRGCTVSSNVTPNDLCDLAAIGANCIRFPLNVSEDGIPPETPDYILHRQMIYRGLSRLDGLLPTCEALDLRVVLVFGTTPGGRPYGGDHLFLTDPAARAFFNDIWWNIALKYRGNRTIIGYDLCNEPVGPPDVWRAVATETARMIRCVDTNTWIIVESIYGNPHRLRQIPPLPVHRVVMSVHMYDPHEFTHQRIPGPDYPQQIVPYSWDVEHVRRSLRSLRRYQERYQVPIYIGEFSAVRWAPDRGAKRYLADCIEVFEENGWSWTYHAWREADVWSVEHTTDINNPHPKDGPTGRLRLLRRAFQKNR